MAVRKGRHAGHRDDRDYMGIHRDMERKASYITYIYIYVYTYIYIYVCVQCGLGLRFPQKWRIKRNRPWQMKWKLGLGSLLGSGSS